MAEAIQEQIMDVLEDKDEGASSTEIAEKLEVDRHTLAKHLDVLTAKGYVNFRQLGMAKLWFATKIPLLALLEKEDVPSIANVFDAFSEGITILDKDFGVLWANKKIRENHGELKKIKGAQCYKAFDLGNDVCANCPSTKTFKTGSKEKAVEVVIDKNGDKKFFEIASQPIKDNKGKTVAVLEIIRGLEDLDEINKRVDDLNKKIILERN